MAPPAPAAGRRIVVAGAIAVAVLTPAATAAAAGTPRLASLLRKGLALRCKHFEGLVRRQLAACRAALQLRTRTRDPTTTTTSVSSSSIVQLTVNVTATWRRVL